jgi:hypothetical protein
MTMGLIRGVARTAVIAGTATAVSNRVSRRQAGRWSEQDQARAYQEQQAYEAQQAQARQAAPPAEDDMESKIAQLQKLAALKDQGVLTEAEFAAQKAAILG